MNEEMMREISQIVKDLAEAVRAQNAQIKVMEGTALSEEKIQKIVADLLETQEKARKVASRRQRTPWAVGEADPDQMNPLGISHHAMLPQRPTLHKAIFMTGPELSKRFSAERVADITEFQGLWDDVYLCSVIRGVHPSELWGEEYALYQRLQERGRAISKALDTATTGEGTEWVATAMSANFIEMVHLNYQVAGLFEHFAQPVKSYPWPISTSDATAYYVPEALDDNSAKIPASTPGTDIVTFTARKFAGRIWTSTEYMEDSIIPVLPKMKADLANALTYGVEDCLINGDRTATHQDSDVLAATDARKAFAGLRFYTQAAAKKNLGTFSASTMRTVRQAMGKFGVMPINQLAWIIGIAPMGKILDFDEVKTVDKYGPNATILVGEIGKLDGIPLIVSEKIREDLNALGVYNGIVVTQTIVQLVWRPGFMIGDRRIVTIKTDEDIQTDQLVVVATQRLDFEPMRPTATEYLTAQGYNITS